MAKIMELEREVYELEKKYDERGDNLPFVCQELRTILDTRRGLYERAREGATPDVIQNARDDYVDALKKYIRCLRENL